jgi:hypothetical protein
MADDQSLELERVDEADHVGRVIGVAVAVQR